MWWEVSIIFRLRRAFPAPLQNAACLHSWASEARWQKHWFGLGLNYVLDIITEREFNEGFNELLINDVTRHSTDIQAIDATSKAVAIRARHAPMYPRYPNRMTPICGNRWPQTLGINSHSGTCFMDHFSMSLAVNYYSTILQSTHQDLQDLLCHHFHHHDHNTPKLNRIQTGHFMTYLASMMGNITRKQQPLCSFKVSILIKSISRFSSFDLS